MIYPHPLFRAAGDSAVLIDFADEVNDTVNSRVHFLAQLLHDQTHIGLTDLIPTYSSLLVCFDQIQTRHSEILPVIEKLLEAVNTAERRSSRLVQVPTRYGGELGPDLEFVAHHNHISVEEVIQLHTSIEYRVYMLGFLPGFAYMGSIPERIAAPRLHTPRVRVPAGSVGIAGRQTGIYPVESPGGWQLIGRADIKLFDPIQDPPTLFRPGDRIRFVQI